MAYRRTQYYRRQRRYTANYRAAQAHIEEARAFEDAIGDPVKDVKQYFLEMNSGELTALFKDYGARYGRAAENYARTTFPKWKAGSTTMSGLVAKRIFEFLPPRLPPAVKLELARNIWTHFGSKSSHHFTVGPSADIEAVMVAIVSKLDDYVADYTIPDEIKERFDWLSEGDIEAKEALLNYFRKLDGTVAADSLRLRLPILQAQMQNHESTTSLITTSFDVHGHHFEISIDERLGADFHEGRPTARQRIRKADDGLFWFVVVFGGFIFFLLMLGRR
jgi:hypothetical protein